MRKTTKMLLAVTLMAAAGASAHAADVGLSISVGQPGFYGQLNIGGYPPPVLVYRQPTVVDPDYGYEGPPLYLHVPSGYVRHWREHCAEFRACHRRVYFVRDDWYENEYAPRYRREHHDDGRWQEEHRDRRDEGNYGRRDDRYRRDERGHDHRGRGHEHGDRGGE